MLSTNFHQLGRYIAMASSWCCNSNTLSLYHFLGAIEPIRPHFNNIPQRWWFAEVITGFLHQLVCIQVKPSLVRTLGRPLSSWSRPLEEATKLRKGVIAISLWRALCSESRLFFLRMANWPHSACHLCWWCFWGLNIHWIATDHPFVKS